MGTWTLRVRVFCGDARRNPVHGETNAQSGLGFRLWGLGCCGGKDVSQLVLQGGEGSFEVLSLGKSPV